MHTRMHDVNNKKTPSSHVMIYLVATQMRTPLTFSFYILKVQCDRGITMVWLVTTLSEQTRVLSSSPTVQIYYN